MTTEAFQVELAAFEAASAALTAKINAVYPVGTAILVRSNRGRHDLRLGTISAETITHDLHVRFPSGFSQRIHFSRVRKNAPRPAAVSGETKP